VLIPAIIFYFTPSTIRLSLDHPLVLIPVGIGIILIIAGSVLFTKTVLLFSRVGEGTLAPWDPTRKLVVIGPYRYVRNPMIISVFAILLGESILFGSFPIFVLFFIFWILAHTYFIKFEEPGLIRRFGEEYVQYCENVPRWIPRVTPWKK
jgi:protein-S-isoprenylcysteine O-methyltransferase Ste14